MSRAGVVLRPEGRPRDGFDGAARGDASWVTLFSADRTPTSAMSCGLAELAPRGGRLASHRHAQPEIYDILEGRGVVTVSGVETTVAAGAAVFIPGDAEHGIRSEGEAALRFFHVFPVDRFFEVADRFA